MSLDDGLSKFLGSLYEAVFDAREWQSAMDQVARLSGSSAISVATTDLRLQNVADHQMYGLEAAAAEMASREYAEEMYALDPVFSWLQRHPHAGRCDSASVVPEGDYHDREIVKWSRSRFGAAHWSVFYTEPIDDLAFNMVFLTADEKGQPTRQQSGLQALLFENVERAIRLAARPPNFASDDSALIAIDADGRPLSLSQRAEDLLRDVHCLLIRDGVLTALDPVVAGRLRSAIRTAVEPTGVEAPDRGIRLSCHGGQCELLAIVSPLPPLLNHLPAPVPAALVRIVELATPPAFLREHAHLFDLTPRETEIATSLLEGHSIESLSASLGLSPNTARNHVQSLFRKTGTNRQSELVKLLDRLARQ